MLCSATRMHWQIQDVNDKIQSMTSVTFHLLDHVRAELLHGERTNVAGELTDHAVAEPIVVEVQNVLHDL